MSEPALPSGRGLARNRHHLVRLALLTLGWGLLVTGLLAGGRPGPGQGAGASDARSL